MNGKRVDDTTRKRPTPSLPDDKPLSTAAGKLGDGKNDPGTGCLEKTKQSE
jgi:hypothetical protein